MRIGELAERTGASRRLLRYYEEQQLIASGRSPNGYREYDESVVGRVMQVRGLLDAGLPTRVIQQILPCLDTPQDSIRFSGVTPETVAVLEGELSRMSERIRFLTRNRNAIADYLDALRSARQAGGG
ncbi:MerR family transcriptional regulator [Streptomyces sp. NBC_01476]|uniref:MerR family transcriptional regulator n=1 Tax=Streptomyces sp. NBC_01476 TaxID=2903881 RepID=UPI002E324287|nr:MerR family transcriptional regulator [Streptomyces sp. NBC_01476]